MFRGRATLAAGLTATAAATAALLAPTSAIAACPTQPLCFRTDEHGTYRLHLPPLASLATFEPKVVEVEDCNWANVAVNFGDGGPGETVTWDATKEFTGSHTFPHPGEYTVQIDATQGHHQPSGEPCPDLPITATVTFPTPTPPPKEEPKEESRETPKETGPKPGDSHGSGGSSGTKQEEGEKGASHPILLWHRCGSDVYAQGVACTRARKVIKGALKKLTKRGSAPVAGFRCRLNPDEPRPISCHRGSSRILGPTA
ncbi:MAG: hypothetical protein ACHQCF_00175 [Solirubrobacterales bacterium]